MTQRPVKLLWGSSFYLPLVILSLVLTVALAGSAPVLAKDSQSPLSTHLLLPGIKAEITADGSLIIFSDETGELILTAAVPELVDSRRSRRRGKSQDTARFSMFEGVAGGLRGFSAGADDDADGSVDEDRCDGLDNDGDGLVDEDFAAISDDMAVVHRHQGSASVHLESYHWCDPGLRSSVFLSLSAAGSDLAALEVALKQGAWLETDTSYHRHSVTGRAAVYRNHPFVTHVQKSGSGPGLWLAIMVLGDHPGYLARGSKLGDQLDFPLSEEPLPLVICAAPSWLQLTRMLTESDLVFRGVADPLNKQTASWIVPATCSQCRTSSLPEISLSQDDGQSLVLKMQIKPGQNHLVDPDLFALDGQALGCPDEISWRPATGSSQALDWSKITPTDLRNRAEAPVDPFTGHEGLGGHSAEGILEFHFEDPIRQSTLSEGKLTGRWLYGRPFQVEVLVPENPSAIQQVVQGSMVGGIQNLSPDQSQAQVDTRQELNSDRQPPSLSPTLLEGWPNPFRDRISIKFKVPETVGEAFVWVDREDTPKGLDSQAAVPWSGSNPSVSIKIYNINGQELITLHSASVSTGEYTVNWNGTDIFGRQVASGTYFCKLQLDEWSVTRRLVFLR